MMAEQPVATMRLIALDQVVKNLSEEAYTQLQELTINLKDETDASRKRALLSHLHTVRQRLQRLSVVLAWAHKAPAVAECKRILEVTAAHTAAFRDSADQLAYLHGELLASKVPQYDVATATHILRHGGYSLLPSIIEEELKPFASSGTALADAERDEDTHNCMNQESVIRRMNFLLRAKLLKEGLPRGMTLTEVRDGQVVVRGAHGVYCAVLSLVPAPAAEVALAKWAPEEATTAVSPVHAERDVKLEEQTGGGGGGEGDGRQSGVDIKIEEAAAPGEMDSIDGKALEIKKEIADGEHPGIACGSDGAAAAGGDDTADATGEQTASATLKRSNDECDANDPSCWRWRLLSFELLPGYAAGGDAGAGAAAAATGSVGARKDWRSRRRRRPPVVPPELLPWLQRNIEDRMWAAADIQQLQSLGRGELVVVPPQPLSREQRAQRQQQQLDDIGRGTASELKSESKSQDPNLFTATARGSGSSMDTNKQPPPPPAPPQGWSGSANGDGIKGTHEEEAKPGIIPSWASSPLAALHAVLQCLGVRVAVGSVLAAEAERLAKGSWAGLLRLDAAPRGSRGLRLIMWPQVPLVSSLTLQSLQASAKDPADDDDVAMGDVEGVGEGDEQRKGKLGCMIDVVLTNAGDVTCTTAPQLIQIGPSLENVALQPFGDSHALTVSAERLLFSAARYCASTQLAAIASVLTRDVALKTALGDRWLVLESSIAGDQHGNNPTQQEHEVYTSASVAPALELSVDGEPYLVLYLALKSGRPRIRASPVLSELAEMADVAESIAQQAQQALDRRSKEALADPLPHLTDRAQHWVTIVAGVVSVTLRRLAVQRRKTALLADAVSYGYIKSALPRCLSTQASSKSDATTDFLRQFPWVTGDSCLVLELPGFCSKSFRLGEILGEEATLSAGGNNNTATVVAFLCVDSVFLTPTPTTTATAGQQESASLPGTNIVLALCVATSLGVPIKLLRFVSPPTGVLSAAADSLSDAGVDKAEQHQLVKKRQQTRGKRKRPAAEDEQGEKQHLERQRGIVVPWEALLSWAHRLAAWHQISLQLDALGVPYSTEPMRNTYNDVAGIDAPFPAFKIPKAVDEVRLAALIGGRNEGDGSRDDSTNASCSFGDIVLSLNVNVAAHRGTWRTRLCLPKCVVALVKARFGANLGATDRRKHPPPARFAVADTPVLDANIAFDDEDDDGSIHSIVLEHAFCRGHTVALAVSQALSIFAAQELSSKLRDALDRDFAASNGVISTKVAIDALVPSSFPLDAVTISINDPFAKVTAAASGCRDDMKEVSGRGLKEMIDKYLPKRVDLRVSWSLSSSTTAGETDHADRASEWLRSRLTWRLQHIEVANDELPRWAIARWQGKLQNEDGKEFLASLAMEVPPVLALQSTMMSAVAQRRLGLLPEAVLIQDFGILGEDREKDMIRLRCIVRQLGRAVQFGIEVGTNGVATCQCRQLPLGSTGVGLFEDNWLHTALQEISESENCAFVSIKPASAVFGDAIEMAFECQLNPRQLTAVVVGTLAAVSRING